MTDAEELDAVGRRRRHGAVELRVPRFDDTAAYTAAAALDERPVPDKLFVAGNALTFDRLVKEVEAGLGAPITVKSLGSVEDLDGEITNRYAAQPANVPSRLPLMYWRAMLSGSGKLGPLMNDRDPDIRPAGVREYVSRLATERTYPGLVPPKPYTSGCENQPRVMDAAMTRGRKQLCPGLT